MFNIIFLPLAYYSSSIVYLLSELIRLGDKFGSYHGYKPLCIPMYEFKVNIEISVVFYQSIVKIKQVRWICQFTLSMYSSGTTSKTMPCHVYQASYACVLFFREMRKLNPQPCSGNCI